MKALSVTGWTFRFILLVVLFILFFMVGSQAVAGFIPDIASEPGVVSPETGILVISIINTLLITGIILNSRWTGWKLALGLSFAYYGTVTFVMQIETWYFLSDLTVGAELLPRLFMMGIPVALFFITLAVLVLGKGRRRHDLEPNYALIMPVKQWILKLGVIALIYLILYWGAGYFIAWQNPELRAFYGSPGEIQSFWLHTANTLRTDPGLFPFQILRAMLWVLFALPVIRSSISKVWGTAIMVGLLFSIPQNLSHILENPLLPIASVRFSHMIETASSTFIFGMIVVGCYTESINHLRDLFGR